MRDIGPTFLTGGRGLAAADWTFNGWGAQEWASWEHNAGIGALLAEGISRGDFRPADPERTTVRLRALPDGFGVPLVIGLLGMDREQALGHV